MGKSTANFNKRVYWISNKMKGEQKTWIHFQFLAPSDYFCFFLCSKQSLWKLSPLNMSVLFHVWVIPVKSPLHVSFNWRTLAFPHPNCHKFSFSGALTSVSLVQSWFAFCQHLKGRTTSVVVTVPTYLQIFQDFLQICMLHWFVLLATFCDSIEPSLICFFLHLSTK